MLPTRYQKRNCDKGYCEAAFSDLTRHNKYEWRHQPYYQNVSMLPGVQADQSINLCIIGASHARHLKDQAKTLALKDVLVVHILSQFPNTFDIEWLSTFECSYALIGYGQWPLGATLKGAFPYSMVQYEEEVRHVMTQIKQSNTTTQVFFNSMNYNSLGAMYTSCPPIDHRYPPIVDMVNAIMLRLAAEFQLEYIDLNHIIGPLWDAALDWGHPGPKIFIAEARYVFHTMFSYSIEQQKAPVFVSEAGHVVKENTLVRFTISETYYLYSRGVLRAFPNIATLEAMQYQAKSAVVFRPTAKLYAKKGIPLPRMGSQELVFNQTT
jgi:hypothetical protein